MGLTPAEFSSPNFNDRPKDIVPNILVIHYTGMQSLDQALQRLMSSNSQVSAHYLISRKGEIFKLLREALTGYKAGPEMSSLIIILGKEKVLERLNN